MSARAPAPRPAGAGWRRRDPTPPGPHLPAGPAPPRPGGAHTARAALAPKCVTGTGRAPPAAGVSWHAASAGRARGDGSSPGLRPRPGRRWRCPALGRYLERLWRRRAARQGPTSAVVGLAKATLSLPAPSLPPVRRRQRRFPLGETTRILPGAPRPAPGLRPLPFAGEPGPGRAGEETRAAWAGRRRGGPRSR